MTNMTCDTKGAKRNMEDLIKRSTVLNRLEFIRMETEINMSGPATRRKALLGVIDDIKEFVNDIMSENEMDALYGDAPEEDEEQREPETVQKDKYLEPLMTGSNIGIHRYHCGRCNTIVGKDDPFCKGCGAKFGDTVDHGNRFWDTDKACVAAG